MSPTRRLQGDWLTLPSTRAVMAALEAARPGGARYVGGCVRNEIRGLAVDDIDIATQILPQDVMAAMETAGIRAIPTGIEHGTVTAIADGRPYEITTLRRDVETDGRRAVVSFTEDWAEDAARRDFRMNAIYAAPDGSIEEVVPGSVDDAIAGRVIFIGDADQRLIEDYLRILRFFRFNAWYGAGVDEPGLAACARQKDGLKKIAAERIWKEMKRTLAAPDPSVALMAMEDSGVLDVVLPAARTSVLPGLIAAEQGTGAAPDPMQRLMALLPRRLTDVEAASRALRLSNAERDRLADWASPALGHVVPLGPEARRETLYRFGAAAVKDRALVDAAQGAPLDDVAAVLKAAEAWQRPVLPVDGNDALKAGFSGPEVGAALASVEADWIASDFTLTRDALLSRLKPAG
ncbi:MAG: CCA tRNA nucleotidyltransferase [Hyphomonas sp.]|uniref:CCA tRNA nucleotidyltransferase n=1 Tax=Hyphomonas sp. TaxID=87 RepID=UPI00352886C8